MKSLITLIASAIVCAALAIGLCSGTNKKNATEQMERTETVKGVVNEIDASVAVNVIYTVNSSNEFVCCISGEKQMVERTEVKLKGKTLYITMKNKTSDNSVVVNNSEPVTVKITGPAVYEFEASSAASIVVESDLSTSGEIEVEASSAGNVEFSGNVSASKVEIEASSAAKVGISGELKCNKLEIEASSAARVKCPQVASANCRVDIEASSSADVTVEGKCSSGEFDVSSCAKIDARKLVAGSLTISASSMSEIKCNTAEMTIEKSTGAKVKNYR